MRSIFFRQIREALLLIIVVWGILIAFSLAGRASGENIYDSFYSLYLLIGPRFLPIITFFGFALGERSFSAEFKERHLLFYSSLPIKRSTLWVRIIGARFLTVFPFLLTTILIRELYSLRQPTVLKDPLNDLAISALFFSMGVVFSVLIRKVILVYALGLPTAILAFLTVTGLVELAEPVRIKDFRLTHNAASLLLLISSLSILLLSRYLFVRLETSSSRQRLKSVLILAGWLVATNIGIFSVIFRPGFMDTIDDLLADQWYDGSPDHDYFARRFGSPSTLSRQGPPAVRNQFSAGPDRRSQR